MEDLKQMYTSNLRILKHKEHNHYTIQTCRDSWWQGLGDTFTGLSKALDYCKSLFYSESILVIEVDANNSENGFTYWYIAGK